MSSSAPQKRGRRYGSDYARAWARGLHFGDVRTKATLNAICNYVDEDGSCWPSIGTLADDTDQSDDSIRRRLVVLEKCGVLARLPRWRDERGKINYDENGKRTTDEIRLLFSAVQEEIDAALGISTDNSDADSGEPADEISPSHQQGLNNRSPGHQRGPSPSHQQGTPSHCSEGLSEPILDPNSTQSPSLSETGVASSGTGNGSIPYDRFAETYLEPSTKPKEARSLWDSFTDPERDLAVRGARGYRSQRLATKKPLIDPERFLRNRDLWTEFAAEPAANVPSRVLVDAETDAGRAWISLHRIGGVPAPSPVASAGRSIMSLAAEVPVQVLALKRAPPEREWEVVEPGSQEIGAWREFVFAQTGKMPIPQRHITGERHSPGKDGKPVFVGHDHRHGLKVPAPFPPRVDGSWPEVDSKSALAKTG